MWLIVGLGNPGTEYVGTRHNIGFDVIEQLSKLHSIPVRKRSMKSVNGNGTISGTKVILVRPMTFMNLSGEAVSAFCRMYKIEPENVIVVVDDIALPTGGLRLRLTGSAGGHNGLTSIEQHLHSKDYKRIRVGVGAATPGRMVDHVLGKFGRDERDLVELAIAAACDAIQTAVADGFDVAMNRFNKKPTPA